MEREFFPLLAALDIELSEGAGRVPAGDLVFVTAWVPCSWRSSSHQLYRARVRLPRQRSVERTGRTPGLLRVPPKPTLGRTAPPVRPLLPRILTALGSRSRGDD